MEVEEVRPTAATIDDADDLDEEAEDDDDAVRILSAPNCRLRTTVMAASQVICTT
jgi:hypothetical protein